MMKRTVVLIVAGLATSGFSVLQLGCGGGDRAQEQPPAAQVAPPAAPAPEAAPPPAPAPLRQRRLRHPRPHLVQRRDRRLRARLQRRRQLRRARPGARGSAAASAASAAASVHAALRDPAECVHDVDDFDERAQDR